MLISLIRPPSYSAGLMGAQLVPYLGIAYVASAARAAGHEVDIIDMCGEDIDHIEIVQGRYVAYGMPFSALPERVKPSEVIGITCMFSQDWTFHRSLIQEVRKILPDSLIVAGGEHVSAVPDYCLQDCKELDVCVIGEGEEIFSNLLSTIENKTLLRDVNGISYRDIKTKEICHNQRCGRIKDIDSILPPAWDLMPMENYLKRGLTYHIQRGRTIPMLASRGCPYNCTFCSNSDMWASPWVARDSTMVVDEMESYVKGYAVNNFVFSDLTAVVRRENIVELCNRIIERKLNITWQLPTLRTESLSRDVLQLMYKAGCRELDFAIESGSKAVLAQVRKGNKPEAIVSLIKDGLTIGFNFSINIILGLPGEGVKDFLKTYLMVMKLAISGLHEMNAFPFVPYPGSKLFKDFVKCGKVKLNDTYFLNLYGFADIGMAVSWSEEFSAKTLGMMRFFLMASFYSLMFISHPKRIVRLVINIINGVSTTKFEGVIKRVIKNRKAANSLLK